MYLFNLATGHRLGVRGPFVEIPKVSPKGKPKCARNSLNMAQIAKIHFGISGNAILGGHLYDFFLSDAPFPG